MITSGTVIVTIIGACTILTATATIIISTITGRGTVGTTLIAHE